ncbi:MAG: alpha-L-fucosidase [Lachnospiraceae bacterium]|nr:alpha-L-fucosidase [Lachnospiraceae bacterium]
MSLSQLDCRLTSVVPSRRQLAHQQLEFYAFIHFTVNTFTDREWGDGTEEEQIFNPAKLDARQWARAAVSAGMKGMLLTCKHHDGFCLWPSKYTTHTVANSPYKNGQGDIVREVSDACREYGLKFGIYLSPWDRNYPTYGFGEPYNDYFVNQLTELLTGYGEIFSVWFDGACGEGSNGKKQVYDWERYERVIRELQPNACISVCGPDVRWCGNEAGDTRPSEWSVVPLRTKDTERIAENSQHEDDAQFRERKISAMDLDLGSRCMMKNEGEAIWYPAEVNTSIRPGWFYHESEDDKVRSLEELKRIYYGSVGGNGMFLLNIPPDRNGLIHPNDQKRLKELGDWIRQSFAVNLMDQAELSADRWLDGSDVEQVREDSYASCFRTEDGDITCTIDIRWSKMQKIGHLVLKEDICQSQRIERFLVEAEVDGKNVMAYYGSVVGYKKIIPLNHLETDHLRIRILDSRVAPTLSFIGVYEDQKAGNT